MEPILARPLPPLALPVLQARRLSNGLTLLAGERFGLPLVSMVLVLPFGTAHDPRGKDGLTDFVTQLLRRGTERRTASEVDDALEAMGASLRLETSPDATFVRMMAPSEHVPALMRLLAELLQRPALGAREISQARERLVARLQTELDDPSHVAGEAIARLGFGRHPYARAPRGLTRTVRTFTRPDCVALFRSRFGPARAFLVMVGDVPAEEALGLGETAFADWARPTTGLPALPPVSEIEGRRILIVDQPELTQAQIRIACRSIPRHDPELLPARLANTVFGGSFTSRLVESIRVERGLSYGVSSSLGENDAGGLFAVASYTKTETVRELLDVVLEEARRFRQTGATREELARAQSYTNGLYPLALETVDQYAFSVADAMRLGRPDDWLSRYRERISAVDAEQVHRASKRFMLPSGWALTVVGDARSIAPQLKSFGKARRTVPETLL